MITYLIIGITVLISWNCFQDPEKVGRLSLNPYRAIHKKEWYRIISHGFVHADMTHLLVNMFTFWSFGTYIESLFGYAGFGKLSYLFLYFGGMIVASGYDMFKQKSNPYYSSIGASGAVSAVLFSYIFFDPWGKIYLFALLPIPGILFGVLYLLYCQAMARKSNDNINHNAHFWGAVYGFLFPALLRPSSINIFISSLGLE